MVLDRKTDHGQQMTPIHFEVTRSKVKVIVAFNAKTMSAQYLEKFLSDSHSTWQEDWSWSVDDTYIFEVTRSKVKVTVAFNAKTVSAQNLEKFMSDSHGTWQEDWSWSLDDPYKF